MNYPIAIGILLLIILIWIIPFFRFKKPTGIYSIGTRTLYLNDTNRMDLFSSQNREVIIQIYYPSNHDDKTKKARYIPDEILIRDISVRYKIPYLFLSFLKLVKTNSNLNARPDDSKAPYPILLFFEGLNGFRQMNTFQCEELASQGYVVVALDQPYIAGVVTTQNDENIIGFPCDEMLYLEKRNSSLNNKVLTNGILPYFAKDASFVIDFLEDTNHKGQFPGNLCDLSKIGCLGVSMGGMVISELICKDSRVRAVLFMDSPMSESFLETPPSIPCCWMTRPMQMMHTEGWKEEDIDTYYTVNRNAYLSHPSKAQWIEYPSFYHLNFTDIGVYTPVARWMGLVGPTNPQNACDKINDDSKRFFHHYLKGELNQ